MGRANSFGSNRRLITRCRKATIGSYGFDIGLCYHEHQIGAGSDALDLRAIALGIGNRDPSRALAAKLYRNANGNRLLGHFNLVIGARTADILDIGVQRWVRPKSGNSPRSVSSANTGIGSIDIG